MIVGLVLIALVAGGIGGVMGAAFSEAYFQRREWNRVSEFEDIR